MLWSAERAVVRTATLRHFKLKSEVYVIHILSESKRKDYSCEEKARKITRIIRKLFESNLVRHDLQRRILFPVKHIRLPWNISHSPLSFPNNDKILIRHLWHDILHTCTSFDLLIYTIFSLFWTVASSFAFTKAPNCMHCIKNVRTRSYSGPHFPVYLWIPLYYNTNIYEFLCIIIQISVY